MYLAVCQNTYTYAGTNNSLWYIQWQNQCKDLACKQTNLRKNKHMDTRCSDADYGIIRSSIYKIHKTLTKHLLKHSENSNSYLTDLTKQIIQYLKNTVQLSEGIMNNLIALHNELFNTYTK